MTPDQVNHSQAGNVFCLGAGGILVVILSAYFGRLPVMWWFLIITTGTAAWCAGATSFESFFAARVLNGFFSTLAQIGGLMFIQDMFFFHERARKINIWASFFVISPYMGPLLAAFMLTTQPWPAPFWLFTALAATSLVLVTLFLRETYYDRRIPAADQPSLGSRIAQLTGLAQFRSRHLRNTFPQAVLRTVLVLMKPSIFLGPQYGFGTLQIGYFYFTPIVGVLIGEVTGHWLHDLLAKQYIRSHHGRFEPEVRLRAICFSTPFSIIGLVLVGQSLQNDWHFMATSVAWGVSTSIPT